jgi:hypothetical protein
VRLALEMVKHPKNQDQAYVFNNMGAGGGLHTIIQGEALEMAMCAVMFPSP